MELPEGQGLHGDHHSARVRRTGATLPGNILDPKNSNDVKNAVAMAQIQILLVYFLAGTWKLVSLLQSFFDPNIASGLSFFKYALAGEYYYSLSLSPLSDSLLNSPTTALILSFGAILFQSLSIFVVFFPSMFWAWGILIAVFHIGSLAGLNIIFHPAITISLIFLTLSNTEDK